MEGKSSQGKRGRAKAHRLVGRESFREVINTGQRTESRFLKIFKLEGKDGPARAGIIVDRKSAGAVKRNRFKRRVREAVRASGAFRDGTWLVVIAGPGAVELSYAEVADHIARALGERRGG